MGIALGYDGDWLIDDAEVTTHRDIIDILWHSAAGPVRRIFSEIFSLRFGFLILNHQSVARWGCLTQLQISVNFLTFWIFQILKLVSYLLIFFLQYLF